MGFDVAVHDTPSVDRVQAQQKLQKVSPDCILSDGTARALVHVQHGEERAIGSVLHDEVELTQFDEGVEVFHNEGVLQLLEQPALA